MTLCKIDGCDRVIDSHGARGMCSMHYKRWNFRGGDPSEKIHDPSDDPKALKAKFDRKWKADPVTGCWVWIGTMHGKRGHPRPRGAMQIKRRRFTASRVSWLIHRGEIPRDQWILHRCDNSLCVNPDHLYLGDHQQNMVDMSSRSRTAHIKLTPDQVRFIRNSPLLLRELAEMFGVSIAAIGYARNKQHYKHVS